MNSVQKVFDRDAKVSMVIVMNNLAKIPMANEYLKGGVLGGVEPQLSARQRDVLGFMYSYFMSHKRYPSHQEISDMLGVTSRTAAANHINAMEKKGFILKVRGKAKITESGLYALNIEDEENPIQPDLL